MSDNVRQVGHSAKQSEEAGTKLALNENKFRLSTLYSVCYWRYGL